jgi:predicted DNA-binding protein
MATDDPPVPKESDRPGKRITIRVSLELYEAIEKLAKRDRRTIAGWLKIAAEDAVAAAGAGPRKR